MTALLSCLALAIAPTFDEKGLSLIRQMAEALKSIHSVELIIEGERPGSDKVEKAQVKAAKQPVRYWAKLLTATGSTEYAALDGLTMRYTGGDGARKEREVPSHLVAVNNASSVGYYGWLIFLEEERFVGTSSENCNYIHSEEIEGKMCDLVAMERTVNEGEQITSIRYYWIDRATHLPAAFQVHSFVRGRSTAGPKWLLRDVRINPVWPQNPFRDVPLRAEPITSSSPSKSEPEVRKWVAGDECPVAEVESLKLEKLSLRSLLEGKTLLTFWAPW